MFCLAVRLAAIWKLFKTYWPIRFENLSASYPLGCLWMMFAIANSKLHSKNVLKEKENICCPPKVDWINHINHDQSQIELIHWQRIFKLSLRLIWLRVREVVSNWYLISTLLKGGGKSNGGKSETIGHKRKKKGTHNQTGGNLKEPEGQDGGDTVSTP